MKPSENYQTYLEQQAPRAVFLNGGALMKDGSRISIDSLDKTHAEFWFNVLEAIRRGQL